MLIELSILKSVAPNGGEDDSFMGGVLQELEDVKEELKDVKAEFSKLKDFKAEFSTLRDRVKILEESQTRALTPRLGSECSSLVPSQQVSSSQEFRPNSLSQALQVCFILSC